MQLPDLNLLVALDALLDEGSVVGAARRMHLSPAAMSRTLTRIREAVGDPILVRAGRGLVPTPKALALQAQVRSLVEQAGQVFRSAEEVELASLTRRFNVRANDVFVGAFGGKLLAAMGRQAPNAELRFVPEGESDDEALREGRIDLRVCSVRNLGPEILTQTLFNTMFVGLAREDHPIFAEDLSAESLCRYAHISVSRRGRALGPIDTSLAAMGLTRRVSMISPNFHSAMFTLQDSDLILPLPELALWGAPQQGLRLRAFALPLPLESVVVIQAWHPRMDKDPAHRWLRQTLKACCDERSRAPGV
ncbi:LysR family transcriptional regulator [Pseudomonas sp. R5(2019)]|uniref:LysR family transcriptional regulator n=1 Tax=Pseudomonas sp. R5(2019) TaxID=2697566 RepID=UPI0014123699|nr:LysR family transcriptional regulator [Pseudomonas sp. R5(2019)]NBA97823.1 LysR family transcriptional regulator [Pseudomonas sp. R5(2019)]